MIFQDRTEVNIREASAHFEKYRERRTEAVGAVEALHRQPVFVGRGEFAAVLARVIPTSGLLRIIYRRDLMVLKGVGSPHCNFRPAMAR